MSPQYSRVTLVFVSHVSRGNNVNHCVFHTVHCPHLTVTFDAVCGVFRSMLSHIMKCYGRNADITKTSYRISCIITAYSNQNKAISSGVDPYGSGGHVPPPIITLGGTSISMPPMFEDFNLETAGFSIQLLQIINIFCQKSTNVTQRLAI